MSKISLDMSLQQFQFFVNEVYRIPNDRYYEISEMLNNIQRFAMRGIKGIRKGEVEKTKKNLIISFSWFISLLNRIHIEIEEELWKRFPYVCSYCTSLPCSCKIKRPEKRLEVQRDDNKKPKTLSGFQKMFGEIYPPSARTIEHAGIHFSEELGEFSEAIWNYRTNRTEKEFQELKLEAADFISCVLGIFNSMSLNLSEELSYFFINNCHECGNSPCTCSFETVKKYES